MANNTMTNEALEARRAYRREWARKNADKVKAQQARYWQRKAERRNNGPENTATNNP